MAGTIKRKRHQARIVLTLEAYVPLRELPAGRDATDVIRDKLTVAGTRKWGLPQKEIIEVLYAMGIRVTEDKVEVTK